MGSSSSLTIFVVSVATVIILVAAAPWTLSNHNTFLRDFVNQNLLSFIGVVVTISIATASNLYIELNKMEEREGAEIFPNSKKDVKDSVYALLWTLFIALAIAIVKPLASWPGPRFEAAFNGAAVILIIFQGLTLVDLVRASFAFNPIARRTALEEAREDSAQAASGDDSEDPVEKK
ncbi:MAG: hypothetical protein AB7G40_00715 [Hyphomonadaceae bacterium]